MTDAVGASGGETAKDVSAWTPDLIRALLTETDRRYTQLYDEAEKRYEQRFIAQEKAVAAALIAQQTAVAAALLSAEKANDKYEADVERWRIANNEWRAAMLDRETQFVQESTFSAHVKGIDDKLADLLKTLDNRFSEMDKSLGVRLTSLEKSRDQSAGRVAAYGVALVVVFSLITLGLRFL